MSKFLDFYFEKGYPDSTNKYSNWALDWLSQEVNEPFFMIYVTHPWTYSLSAGETIHLSKVLKKKIVINK